MYKMCCRITIGAYSFKNVKEVNVKRSLKTLGDSATIKLPMSAIVSNNKIKLESIIKYGMAVTIELGYDENYVKEFIGFVKQVETKEQFIIECEDNIFKLRKELKNKTWIKTSLEEVIKYVATETGISVSGKIPEINFTEGFIIKDADGVKAIQKICDFYMLNAFFDYDGKLYVGMSNTFKTGTVKYDFSKNIIKHDLVYKGEDSSRLRIKAVSVLKNNKQLKVEVGDSDGDLRTLHFPNITSEAELKKLALAEMEKYKYAGFRGTLTSFLLPIAQYGYTAQLVDDDYNRSGNYLINSVETSFSASGGRRNVELGIKV